MLLHAHVRCTDRMISSEFHTNFTIQLGHVYFQNQRRSVLQNFPEHALKILDYLELEIEQNGFFMELSLLREFDHATALVKIQFSFVICESAIRFSLFSF